MTGIIVGALLLLLAVVMILLHRRSKQAAPAKEGDTPESVPEPALDPNYTSILEDDEDGEDPYDRSYGFTTEDPEETDDEAAEPAEDTTSAQDAE